MWPEAIFYAIAYRLTQPLAERVAFGIASAASWVGWLLRAGNNYLPRVHNGEVVVAGLLWTALLDYALVSNREPLIAFVSVNLASAGALFLIGRDKPLPRWVLVTGVIATFVVGVVGGGAVVAVETLVTGMDPASRAAWSVYWAAGVWATAGAFIAYRAVVGIIRRRDEFTDADGAFLNLAVFVGLTGAMVISGQPEVWARAAADTAYRVGLLGLVAAVVALAGQVLHRLAEGWLLPMASDIAFAVEWYGHHAGLVVVGAVLAAAVDRLREYLARQS